jgi:RNA polymerase sigma-70 factor, ECF subfamily
LQEENLISRLKRHDMSAYEEAIEEYKNYVGAVVKNRISAAMSNEDVEEVVADVFFTLWKQSDKLDSRKGTLKNYLAVIARNLAINKLRERREVTLLEDYMEFNGDKSPESEVIQQETKEILLKEVETLSSPEMEIFKKYYLEGEAIKEIAEDLQLNPNTVKIKLLRSRKKLKNSLLERGYSYENL